LWDLIPTILNTSRGREIVSAMITHHHPDGGVSLALRGWHSMELLEITFRLPRKWHLGEWQIEKVDSGTGRHSVSAELDVLMAEHCDRRIGMNLMDLNAM
jgi:hypothetical protein